MPPFGHSTQLRVFVDPDLLRYDEVWAAAGTWNDTFGAAPADIVRVAGGVVTDLKRNQRDLLCRAEVRNDDLRHSHHGLECILTVVAIKTLKRATQRSGNHLPTDTPTILAPPAHALAAPVAGESNPQTIDVLLGFADNLKAHGFCMGKLRSAVQSSKWSSEELELDRENRSSWSLGIGLVIAHFTEPRSREKIDVELRGIFCLGVEPQKGREIGRAHAGRISLSLF